jgi:hypothetical protein
MGFNSRSVRNLYWDTLGDPVDVLDDQASRCPILVGPKI